ncbi:MAG: glycosyl hydrolase family 28-related protein [Armatimonadota bacterium]
MALSSIFNILICISVFGSMLSAATISVLPGNGVSDDSAGIQKALAKCASSKGGVVILKAGRYRLDKSVTVPSGVTLMGDWEAPHRLGLDKGTVLLVYAGKGKELGPPLIRLMPNSTVKGLTIYYPEQKLPDPIPYPWTIQGIGADCSVTDITLTNSYNAIDFSTYLNQRHYIRNIFGCFLRKGVFVDKSADGRIENVHFSHNFWTRVGIDVPEAYWAPLFADSYLNSTAFQFGHAKNEHVTNTFAIACKIGYHFVKSKGGACNGSFLGIGMDFTQKPLLIEETADAGILITNGEFVAGNGVHTEGQIEVTASHTGTVQFANCSFWGPTACIGRISGSGMVSMSQCNFVLFDWDQVSGWPAFTIDGGSISIINSTFHKGWDKVAIGPDVKTALIMGNVSKGWPLTVESRSTGDVRVVGNVSRDGK